MRLMPPPPPREGLEWPYTGGGGGGVTPPPDPPIQAKGTIVGKKLIYHRANLVGPFFGIQIFGSPPPPSPLF